MIVKTTKKQPTSSQIRFTPRDDLSGVDFGATEDLRFFGPKNDKQRRKRKV